MDINILVSSDRNYLKHTVVALASACAHNPGNKLNIFYLHSGIDQADIDKVHQYFAQHNATITFLYVSNGLISQLHAVGHITVAAYLRILCGVLLPQVDRVIYFDGDVIICDALDKLYGMDLEGNVIAAVRDAFLHKPSAQTYLRHVPGVGSKLDYFNSGVMLIDLDRYREQRVGLSALTLASQFSKSFKYLDQDALNIILQGRWKVLHPRWNVQHMWYEPHYQHYLRRVPRNLIHEATEHPAIVHYCSKSKPWDADNTHPLKSLYWKYRALTPYAI